MSKLIKDKACVESWLNRRNLQYRTDMRSLPVLLVHVYSEYQVGLVGYWYLLVPFNHALGY